MDKGLKNIQDIGFRSGEIILTSKGLAQYFKDKSGVHIDPYPRIYDRVKESLIECKPRMNKEEIELIESYLHKDSKVFEWGSGGSTLHFSKLVDTFVSVEHNGIWHEMIKEILYTDGIMNERVRRGTVIILLRGYNKPDDVKLPHGSLKLGIYAKDYVSAINHVDEVDKYDVILIDGIARPSCLYKALSKADKDTVIFFHDYFKFESYRWMDDKVNFTRPLKNSNLAIIKKEK